MPVEVKVKTSRGLSDDQLQGILSLLNDHAHNNIGDSVLFDLIELTKDTLTSNNIPSCPCPICLAQFQVSIYSVVNEFVKLPESLSFF